MKHNKEWAVFCSPFLCWVSSDQKKKGVNIFFNLILQNHFLHCCPINDNGSKQNRKLHPELKVISDLNDLQAPRKRYYTVLVPGDLLLSWPHEPLQNIRSMRQRAEAAAARSGWTGRPTGKQRERLVLCDRLTGISLHKSGVRCCEERVFAGLLLLSGHGICICACVLPVDIVSL